MRSRTYLSLLFMSALVSVASLDLQVLGVLGEVIVSSPSETVRGQITKVEGQYCMVKDASGREVKLHVDNSTMMMDDTVLKAGETITADMTPKGHATFIITGRPSSNGEDKGQGAPISEIGSRGLPSRP